MRPEQIKSGCVSPLLAIAYFVTGRLGLLLPAFGSHITLIWLPTGLAVAALLRWGYGCWPGIALGAVAVNLTVGAPWPAALGVAVGNTLGPLLAAWMLQRMGFHPSFDRMGDILRLAAAAFAGMLVSSGLGVAVLSLAGQLPPGARAAWFLWWAGDAMGVIAAAPLVLTITRGEGRAILRRFTEFLFWLGATVAVAGFVFVLNRGSDGHAWALAFVPFPLVAWAALRFGPSGTSLAIIVLSVIAASGTATGHGPFYRANPVEGTVVLWIFMATCALLGWLISALHTEGVRSTGLQRHFEQALSDVSLGVLLAGRDRRITYVNQGFTQLTGYSEQELLGKSCALLHGPGTDPETVAKLEAALRGDGFFDGEILNYRQDGTAFWNALLISPVHDEDGVMTGFLGIQRDITERKEAAAELERSLAMLQIFINTVPAYISLVDADERYRMVNKRYEEYFGRPAAQLIGQRVCDVQPAAAYAEMQPHFRAALAGKTVRYQSHPTGPDGKSHWFDVQYVPRRGEDGAVTGFFVLVFDITESKQSEVALHDSEERLRLALFAASQGLYDLNVQTGECIVSPEYAVMLGYDPREFRETNAAWRDRLHPDDREKVYAVYADYVAGRREDYRVEFRQRTKDGGWKWILSLGRLVAWSPDGRPLRMLGTHTDITERKRAEEERTLLLHSLEESQLRLQTLVANLPGMAYRCVNDAGWTMTYVSEGCEAVTSYRREELENNRQIAYADLVHPDDREWLWTKYQASLAARTPCQNEYRILDRHGRERWVSERASGVYATAGSVLAIDGFIQDITAARQARLEHEHLDRKMQEKQKLESLGVLAGGIAHDFNNLLTVILGNASIASVDLPPDSPLREFLDQITEASIRAADLCKQMLAYSGRGRFVVQKLDLGQFVEQTAQMLRISISKKAELQFYLQDGLPPIEADATQIRQVIMNLVLNASEAIGDRSGVIKLSTGLVQLNRDDLRGAIANSDLPEGNYVFLEVSDSGCGMDLETQSRIFDPFFTTKFTGRGLGLAAVLGIVRGHQGAMKVSSEVGRGTTFRLLFPLAAGAGEAVPSPPAVTPQWRGAGTVLVVDDEDTMRTTIAHMMGLIGFDPVLAVDGRDAVEIFHANPGRFMLVLLDLTMPHLDGEQTLAELRRIRPDVRVVLMSGFNSHEVLVRFSGKGLASFLEKPFTLDTLRSTLREVLEGKSEINGAGLGR